MENFFCNSLIHDLQKLTNSHENMQLHTIYLCKHTYYTFDVDIELHISTTYFITSYLYSNQTTHAVSEELEHKLYK